ncbi:MAG: hypothetical protein IKO48_08120 [Elusimicrobia bacterium]|nr:hypothetical protein [Elusimicrobiota bacterium]MBR6125670.1 hypothetical protein [Candidatus Saccharibacteria bacterium]
MPKSALATAQLICLNSYLYEKELEETKMKEKKLTRFRLSKKTVCVCSDRMVLRAAFLDDLQDAMLGLGWNFFQLSDGSFGVVWEPRSKAWTKLSSKRLKNSILVEGSLLRKSEEQIDSVYNSCFPKIEDAVEDEE